MYLAQQEQNKVDKYTVTKAICNNVGIELNTQTCKKINAMELTTIEIKEVMAAICKNFENRNDHVDLEYNNCKHPQYEIILYIFILMQHVADGRNRLIMAML